MKRVIFKQVVFLPLLLAAFNSQAFSCYQKSFEYARLGDRYFEMNSRNPSIESLLSELKPLQQNLADRWRGRMHETECIGPESTVEQRQFVADVDADISDQFERGLKLKLRKRYRENRRVSQENLELLNGVLIHQLQLDPGQLDISEMYRRRTQAGNTVLIEIETELSYSANSILIQQIYFTNGVSLRTKTIELKRIQQRKGL